MIWQMLASVAIPGFTINRICWASKKVLKMSSLAKGSPLVKFTPTLIGLASIPFIIHPIDRGVDLLMDETYRKYVS